MTASQNGWKVLTAGEVAHISLPGGTLTCHPGDIATIFTHLGNRFHNEVEHLVWPGCWGWADRDVRGMTDISNHASGTAIDLNAPKHPMGTDPMQNFTSGQISTVHNILAFYEGVIRWGGDYTGRKDGMHFEINDGVTEAQVAHIAAKCNGVAPAPAPAPAPTPAPAANWTSLPDLAFGQTNDHVKSLQRFLNAYGWRPALPLLPVTGYYGPQTASVLRSAQRQMGILTGDGQNVGPQTKQALWARGWRG